MARGIQLTVDDAEVIGKLSSLQRAAESDELISARWAGIAGGVGPQQFGTGRPGGAELEVHEVRASSGACPIVLQHLYPIVFIRVCNMYIKSW